MKNFNAVSHNRARPYFRIQHGRGATSFPGSLFFPSHKLYGTGRRETLGTRLAEARLELVGST